MRILCTGLRSTVIEAVQQLRPLDTVARIEKRSDQIYDLTEPGQGLRLILAGGYLAGLSAAEHTAESKEQTMQANFLEPLNICDQALADIPDVRICVLGSQSAVKGSYDTEYAAAKGMMHRWVLRQKIQPPQQLVVVAPGIIADSGMTRRRLDYPQVLEQRPHCMAADVAKLIVKLLWEEPIRPGHNSNQVIYVPATVNRQLPMQGSAA